MELINSCIINSLEKDLIIIKNQEGFVVYPNNISALKLYDSIIEIEQNVYASNYNEKYYKKVISRFGEYFVERYIDVTEFINRIELLRIDQTTGLPVKKYLYKNVTEYIGVALEQEEEFSVAMADLDHFKRINDDYSHQMGDYVLNKVAQIHQNNLKGQIIGRFGGEEFLIIDRNANILSSIMKLERIRKEIEVTDLNFEGNSTRITVSFGLIHVSTALLKKVREKNIEVEDFIHYMISEVDQELYKAKNNGRNQISYKKLLIN